MAATDLLPVVDLRLLSHEDLLSLSASSAPAPPPPSAAPSLATAPHIPPIPPIDRSIFNESAGSRKQTYSRLRLSSHPTPAHSPSAAAAAPSFDDNRVIASHLRRLFARDDPAFAEKAASPVVVPVLVPLPSDLPTVEENRDKVEEKRDTVAVSSGGAEVDLVALGGKVDPFGEELAKRTAGLTTEQELLKFLGGLDGQWCSRRCRRRVVDAGLFGGHLPRGWKLLLALKRRDGVASMYCRRYVSPNGHQFSSCKEVSGYLLSLLGHRPAAPSGTGSFVGVGTLAAAQEPGTGSLGGVGTLAADNNDVGSHEQNNSAIKEKCNISSMSNVSSLAQESGNSLQSNSHANLPAKVPHLPPQMPIPETSSSKRRKVTSPLGVALVGKDGKFECPVCHKTFEQKSRYFGHVGAHVRYQGLTPEALLDESLQSKGNQTSSSTTSLPAPSRSHDVPKLQEKNKDSSTPINEVEISTTCGSPPIKSSLNVAEYSGPTVPTKDKYSGDGNKCSTGEVVTLGTVAKLRSCSIRDNAADVNLEIVDNHKDDAGSMSRKDGSEDASIARANNFTGAQVDTCILPDGKGISNCSSPINGKVNSNIGTRFWHDNTPGNQRETSLFQNIQKDPKMHQSERASCNYEASYSKPQKVNQANKLEHRPTVMASSRPDDVSIARKEHNVGPKLSLDAVPSSISYANNGVCNLLDAANRVSAAVKYSDGNHRSVNTSIGDGSSPEAFASSENDMMFDNNTKTSSHSFDKSDLQFETTSEINFASVSPSVGVETNCRQQTLGRQNHLMGFSNDGSGFDLEAYNNDLFSGTITGNNVVQLDSSVGNSKADYSACFSVSDINLPTDDATVDGLNSNGLRTTYGNDPSNANEQYENCTIDINANDSMIEELQKPDIELRDHFGGPDFGRDDLGTVGNGRNIEDMISFQAEFGLSSFVDSVNEAAMGSSIHPEKCDLQLGFGAVKQEVMNNFEERRLFPVRPQFVGGTGQNPAPMGFAAAKQEVVPNFEERRLFPTGPSQFVAMPGQNHPPVGYNSGMQAVFPNFEERRLFPTGPSQFVGMTGQHHPAAMGFSAPKQSVLPTYEERKLFPPGPSQYVSSTGHNPARLHEPQPTLMLGYAPQFGNYPPIQFGWDLSSMQKMVGTYELVSVCIWCNREFRHAGLAEQQSENGGLICPSCKDRFRSN